MAHKTSIGGTAYDIGGGKTLVEGTSYSVKNGKVLIDGTEYDISFILSAKMLDLWSNSSSRYSDIFCITYANGYWVVGGAGYDEDIGTYYARIAYATSLDGNWIIKDLWSGTSSTSDYVRGLIYANGYWVASGECKANNTSYARIAYATSLDGTWTTKDLWSYGSTYYNQANCITYADGYWVVGGEYYNKSTGYARIAYATSPSGTWTTKNLWSGSSTYSHIRCIAYADGYWVVGGTYFDGSYYYAQIAYATRLNGTWTTKTLWNCGEDYENYINCITYANGYWVVGGLYRVDGDTSSPCIAYATSPSGIWTTKILWNDCWQRGIECITYADGYWVAGGNYYDGSSYCYAQIAYATNLDGDWSTKLAWGGYKYYNEATCIIYANGYWVVGGSRYISSTAYAQIAYGESLDSFFDD